MLFNSSSNFLRYNLKDISRCPACETNYQPVAAQLIEESTAAHLLHLSCQRCGTQVLALIMTDSLAATLVGLVTDLKSCEVKPFENALPVTCDDVIDCHTLLNDNKLLTFLTN